MIKRSTKVVSTLVAVSSIMSLTPTVAMATDNSNDKDSSTTSTSTSKSSKKDKVEEKSGEINVAFAYKDGKGVFDGEMKGDDDEDEDIYYYNGSFKSLTDKDDNDFESGDDLKLYGEKYVEVENGEYYIDMSSGSVTDDDLRENDLSDAQSGVRKKIKKDKSDRYTDDMQTVDIALTAIDQNKYQAPWYEGDATSNDAGEFKYNGGAESYHIYTDAKGNYIDADYDLGKILVKSSSTTDSAVKVSVSKTTLKNTKGSQNDLQAVIKHYKTLGADSDYIYRLADLSIYYTGKSDKDDTDISVEANQTTGAGVSVDTDKDSSTSTQGYKNITSTLAFGNKGVTIKDGGDSIRVLQKISKKQNSSQEDDAYIPSSTETYFITDEKGRAVGYYDNISICDGDIITYQYSDDEIESQVLTPSKEDSFYYLETTSDDVEAKSGKFAYDTDVNGNLWALGKGKVYQLDKDYKFTEVYKVDGASNRMSVYDKSNIIIWEDGEDVYSYIGGNSDDKDDDNKGEVVGDNTITEGTTGLVTNADGTMSYLNADGTKATGWVKNPVNNLWYYFQADGTAKTGWLKDNNKWYFLNSDGTMATDWYYDSARDTWYYLNPSSGEMFANGWMTNPHDGYWYYINSNGAMQTGWCNIDSVWYYFNPISNGYRGSMQTGWVCSNSDGKWYYLDSNGAMLCDTVTPDGYKLSANGVWEG